MKWKDGRQNGGYKVYTFFILHWPLGMDCHMLKYIEGSSIPPHIDEVTTGRHFRLNIILKNPEKGGEFTCENTIFRWWRIIFFRPDKYEHSVTEIIRGKRLVFSLGYVL